MQLLFAITSLAAVLASVRGKSLLSVEELTEEPVFKGLDGVYQSSWQRYNTGRIGLKIQKNIEMIDSKSAMEMILAACASSDKAATCTNILGRLKADYTTMVGSVGALFKLLDPYLEQVELQKEKEKTGQLSKNQKNQKTQKGPEGVVKKDSHHLVELEKE